MKEENSRKVASENGAPSKSVVPLKVTRLASGLRTTSTGYGPSLDTCVTDKLSMGNMDIAIPVKTKRRRVVVHKFT